VKIYVFSPQVFSPCVTCTHALQSILPFTLPSQHVHLLAHMQISRCVPVTWYHSTRHACTILIHYAQDLHSGHTCFYSIVPLSV